MPLLFSYGTLQQDDVQLATFGRLLAGSADALVGYAQSMVAIDDAEVVKTSGKTHHPIVKPSGVVSDQVAGTVFEITQAELDQADRYEVAAYRRVKAPLRSGREAWVYVDARFAPAATAPHSIRLMSMADYDAVIALMQQTPGVSFRDADSREATERYLARNPGLSFVAEVDGALVGCVMSGHDGRRGYLQHLLVLPAYRRRGIADALVESCLSALAALGIAKTHIDVLKTNEIGLAYWQSRGWILREDIHRYSFIRGGGQNA